MGAAHQIPLAPLRNWLERTVQTMLQKTSLFACVLVILLRCVASAQVKPSEEAAEGTFGERPFSPYANRTFPSRPLWGETHLHTGLSLDAGAFGNTLSPDDAWRFAKGEQVVS